MKLAIAFFGVVLFCFLGTQVRSSPAQTWEYKFIYQCDEKKTNNIASEGWELSDMSMAAYGSQGVATCVFKRPKN